MEDRTGQNSMDLIPWGKRTVLGVEVEEGDTGGVRLVSAGVGWLLVSLVGRGDTRGWEL